MSDQAINVLIVGASSSIGESIAQKFSGDHYNQLLTCRGELPYKPLANAEVIQLDLCDVKSITRFADGIERKKLKIDICIVLAGILPGKNLVDYSDDMIDAVFCANISGHAKLIRDLLPAFSRGGQIIMMSSISGERGSFDPIYAASKGAVISFVKSLATWLAPDIRVNAIAPSLIDGSLMFDEMNHDRQQYHVQNNPMKSLVNKQDLASVIYDLTMPHWRHLNGVILRVNGGQYI